MPWPCPYCHCEMTEQFRWVSGAHIGRILPPRAAKLKDHSCAWLASAMAARNAVPPRRQPKLLDFYNSSHPIAENAGAAIPPWLARKYDVAIRSWGADIGGRASTSLWNDYRTKFTLEDISRLRPGEHIDLVNVPCAPVDDHLRQSRMI